MNDYAILKTSTFEAFIATQYFINGYDTKPSFGSDLSGIVNSGFDYTIDKLNNKLIVNGITYRLPNGWKKREEAYNNAKKAFE